MGMLALSLTSLTSDPTYYESFWSRPWIMVLLSICMGLIALISICLLILTLLNEAATNTEAKLTTTTPSPAHS